MNKREREWAWLEAVAHYMESTTIQWQYVTAHHIADTQTPRFVTWAHPLAKTLHSINCRYPQSGIVFLACCLCNTTCLQFMPHLFLSPHSNHALVFALLHAHIHHPPFFFHAPFLLTLSLSHFLSQCSQETTPPVCVCFSTTQQLIAFTL